LQFNKEFYFRTAIFLLDSTVAVTVTLLTHTAIGLVFGLMAGALLEVILSFLLIKPVPKLKLDMKKISNIFHKGKWVTLYGMFDYAASEGDGITIGKLLGPGPLGLYELGFTIATLPLSEIANVANMVTFPVYSKISEDLNRLKRAFVKTTMLVSVVSILSGLVLFFFPKELFVFIFGQKWAGVVVVLKPLAVYGAIRGISNTASSLFFALGRQKYVAGITLLRFAVLAITVIPLTFKFGILGAGYSVLLSGAVEAFPIAYYVYKIFKAHD
jgi:PST family polysaccharide transporter